MDRRVTLLRVFQMRAHCLDKLFVGPYGESKAHGLLAWHACLLHLEQAQGLSRTAGVCQLMGSPTEGFKGGPDSIIVRCIGSPNSSHIDATSVGLTHASLHPCRSEQGDGSCAALSTRSLPPLQLQVTLPSPVSTPQQITMKSAAAAAAAVLMLALLCGESRCMLVWKWTLD